MNDEQLSRLVNDIQRQRTEKQGIEVKAATTTVPSSLRETLSAFGNQDSGGVIVLGLDESRRFEAVGVANAHRYQTHIADMASNEMEPTLRVQFATTEIDDKQILERLSY